MAHYEDLSSCDYFGPVAGRLLAIGWLDRAHPFAKGHVARSSFEALARLVANAWQPVTLGGKHACELCVFSGGPSQLRVADVSIVLGATNVFVPADDTVYVAPSLVLHYIDAHEYAPPDAFLRAVEACPPMGSMEYLKAIRRHELHRLGRAPAG